MCVCVCLWRERERERERGREGGRDGWMDGWMDGWIEGGREDLDAVSGGVGDGAARTAQHRH